MATSTHLLTIV